MQFVKHWVLLSIHKTQDRMGVTYRLQENVTSNNELKKLSQTKLTLDKKLTSR